MYKNYGKRLFDLILATMIMIPLVPIFMIVYIFLNLFSNEPAIFSQSRPGKNGKIFQIKKFRTMNNKKDKNGELLSDAERITPIGSFLRKFSLDEIPQLLNVLKGEMSLVGPRPLLPEYLPLYNNHQKKRHDVKPGITGWAQVNGRNAIDWDTKLDMDVWYVEHISFKLDLKIFMMTLKKLVKTSDVSSPTHATMEKFTGSKKVDI